MNQSEDAKQILVRPGYHGTLGIVSIITIVLYLFELRFIFSRRSKSPYNSLFYLLWRNQAFIDILVLCNYLSTGFLRNLPSFWPFFLSTNGSSLPILGAWQLMAEIGGVTARSLFSTLQESLELSNTYYYETFNTVVMLCTNHHVLIVSFENRIILCDTLQQLLYSDSFCVVATVLFQAKRNPQRKNDKKRVENYTVGNGDLDLFSAFALLFCALLNESLFVTASTLANVMRWTALQTFPHAYVYLPNVILAITNPWCFLITMRNGKIKRSVMENTTANPHSVVSNFTISISDLEETLHRWLLIICGVISIFLSWIMIMLIIYRTPMSSRRYRFGLIALQICFIIFDVHVCLLFSPIIPLPFFAGYCTGFLCETAGLSFHEQFIFMFVVALETFACFFMCMLQRHQKLLPPFSNLKLSRTGFRVAVNVAVICSGVGPIAFSTAKLSVHETAMRIEANPEMDWLAKKPGFVVYSIYLRPQLLYVFGFIVLVIVTLSIFCVILMVHTSLVVHSTTTHSMLSKIRAAKAMSNLFMQFLAYVLVIFIPVFVILLRAYVAINSPTLFLVALTIFCIHGIVCSSVALLMNNSFRMLLLAPFRQNNKRHSITLVGIPP
ncbi:sri-18 [Pristionchus pacificus]|uniref:Sri-18 n=1 Tax=Pristionchus pacificus TaxID=54126 RepID=A0A2A6C3J8_PRIPA|nr:sri-18 [Pristionchus pacificus]|eukprot:PDM72591.1 sri-18 [Pristionchus pacificus]